jgi:DNA-directed RNA polymerase sigma subunit (sigma70/sigma32)
MAPKTPAALFWLNNAGRQPLLTPAEELHLGAMVREWQDHPDGPADAPAAIKRRGLRARDRFVMANLRLVAHVAGKRGGLAPRVVSFYGCFHWENARA